ncbi:MAG: tRNA 2-thiouridine(34) synthase MnmA [bacterium]|nr:tRNA 2-thiouridine(34) synthase MnmA [bacterium]
MKSSGAKVFVMMSGGVDSSVAALLLRDQYDVTGVFMKNWSPNTWQSLTDCPWEQDQADAAAVARHLKIKFRSVNFEKEYRTAVVDYFLSEYRAGRTPNPDVMCNKEIKFGVFYRWALAQGADYVASGHYARIVQHDGQARLAKGVDATKDQSYFLWAVTPAIFERVLFPVGELTKKQVRELAERAQLVVAAKKDSQGICFIGHLNVAHWLRTELGVKKGAVVLADGTVVGEHDGAHLYTIGQRHGFKITQPAALIRRLQVESGHLPILFVIKKELAQNRLIVDNRPPATTIPFYINQPQWYDLSVVNRLNKGETVTLECQVRYRQHVVTVEVASSVGINHNSQVVVRPQATITAVTEGQFAVFYHDGLVVGGGIITVGDGKVI